MTETTLDSIADQIRRIETGQRNISGELTGLRGKLAAIDLRLAEIEERLRHLQTIGAWLFAGLLASYAAILAVVLH
jgi:chromosome segregation ATPase